MLKNKFFVIIGLSVITLVLLIVGAVTLHKDNSVSFSNDGYILSTSASEEETYYFKADTRYKKNVDGDVVFNDKDNNYVVVDTANFVHYSNGSIAFLQRGAIVNLKEINNPIISYYNVTPNNIIDFDSNGYVVKTNNDENVSINSFVGRINDNKYIIAGNDLSLKIPNKADEIEGDYFEVLFIEDGIVKIDNEDNNYQVTAQGTYFYIGNDIMINLGDGKIYYDGEAKMLLSQITINGDENIDLAVVDEKDSGGGTGNGDGSGSGTDENDDNGNSLDNNNDNDNDTTNNDNSGEVGSGGSGEASNYVDNASIDLVSADVSTTSIYLKLLLNNASSVKGSLKAYITNVSTGNDVAFTVDTKDTNIIELNNGTFDIKTSDSDKVEGTREFHLNPDTDYLLRIVSETSSGASNQYFQKVFRTKALGISLEKMYATDNSLKYNINFDDNSNVRDVYLNIKGNGIEKSKKVSINDNVTEVEFNDLDSNTNYSVYINNVTVVDDDNGVTYGSRYNISRIDSTLKKTPYAVGKVIDVATDADNAKFTIKLDNISDPDNSIVGYTYEVYLNDEDGNKVYAVTKNVNTNVLEGDDARELVLNLSDIEEMSAGVSYRCRVLVIYNNNEMTRELSIDDGDAFSLKSLPNISWNTDDFVIGKYNVKGSVGLIDASCTIPIFGRSCSDNNDGYNIKNTTFTLKYYVVGEEEKSAKEVKFGFNSNTLNYDFNINGLLSNTNYIMKVYGSYYDDNNNYHENVNIGSAVYFTTAKSDNLALVINNVNTSNDTDVVNFDMYLDKGTSTEVYEEMVTSVTMKLYSGAYNNSDKLIGTYTLTDRTKIEDLFNNFNVNNGLFTNLTGYSVGSCGDNKLCNKNALINATNNSTNTLSNSYTVEISDVMVGDDKLVVENPIYTFILTSSYYLDARISSNSGYNYVVVDEIKRGDLSDDELKSLKKNGVTNIEDLSDDTIVGLKISNTLSDLFVDSAFSYEKAVVNYTVHNNRTNKDVKVINVDMGNKYQPGEQVVWLDLTDESNGFVRGYSYNVGYTIDFTIDTTGLNSDEDVNVVRYDNAKLHKDLNIDRQLPIFTQYISNSTSNSITYKYSMTDIDNALFDKNAYYSYSINDEEVKEIVSDFSFNTDGNYYDVTIPISDRVEYVWGYHKKSINGTSSSDVEMDSYYFDSEYSYDGNVSFKIINDDDNKLKIMLIDNGIHDRAIAYRVVLQANGVSDYSRIFLASNLDNYEDSEDKYIAVDYASISRFMKKNITVLVYAYYDTGLVGLNQDFGNGFVIKNILENKYLNIYNNGSQNVTTSKVETNSMGVNYLRENYNDGDKTIYIYNLFMNTNNYNNYMGASYYVNKSEISGNIGIKFGLSFTNQGLVISDGNNKYSKYNMKVTNVSQINATDNGYRFESITPKVSVNTVNTINSITIKMSASGIYGNNQFIKDNNVDNNIYIEVYSDEDCNNKIKDITSSIDISGDDNSGYKAVIDDAILDNLSSDTNYYFKLFAYMNNKYTQLYDSSSANKYVTKIYNAKTLGGSDILSKIKFDVEPVSYNNEYSNKSLTWQLNFKNTDNFKVRFELYKPDGESYKVVNFNGTDGVNCDININGDKNNGYVNGCYINIDKDDIDDIKNKEQVYSFDGNSFVFGGNYYKMVVYAIPYTNGSYDENDKVTLYETNSLSTTGNVTTNGVSYNIIIPTLVEADVKYNELSSGYDDGYYIDFVPNVIDNYKVIKFGKYNISVRDNDGNEVSGCNIIVNPNNNGGTDSNRCNLDVMADVINSKYRIVNLDSDTLYTIVLSYDVNLNNNGNYVDKNKINDYYVYTPSNKVGVRIGTVSAQRVGNKSFSLTYSGSVNLNYIKKVEYTIQLVGDNSMYSGEINGSESSIFTISGNNVILNVDYSDSGFVITKGESYKINTKYYYDLNKQPLSETTFLEA